MISTLRVCCNESALRTWYREIVVRSPLRWSDFWGWTGFTAAFDESINPWIKAVSSWRSPQEWPAWVDRLARTAAVPWRRRATLGCTILWPKPSSSNWIRLPKERSTKVGFGRSTSVFPPLVAHSDKEVRKDLRSPAPETKEASSSSLQHGPLKERKNLSPEPLEVPKKMEYENWFSKILQTSNC